jgi:hypothetical protein
MKIDFIKFHQDNLVNCFNDNSNTFEKVLYQWCLDNDKKSDFIDLKGIYENSDKIVKNILFINYQEEIEKFITNKFEFTLQDKQTDVDFDKIYSNNSTKFAIDGLNNSEKSLLYFENGDKELENIISKNNSNVDKNQINNNDESIPTSIDIALLDKPILPETNKSKNNYGTYNTKKDKQQKLQGNKAEQCVFNYLVEKYGKDNVKWLAKESDSGHYDIRYKKENKWIYIEVKTFSNNMFYMSEYEKQFADKYKNDYEIFLVEILPSQECKKAKIHILEYNEFEKLEFIPNKYEVHYVIKANKT